METVVNSPPTWISSLRPESVDELADSLIQKAQIHDANAEMEENTDEFELGLICAVEDDSEQDEEEEEEEEEFSFVSAGSGSSTVSSDDTFPNGQIQTFFPLFDQSLLYTLDRNDLPYRPSVKKVFIETEDSISLNPPSSSMKAVEASPQIGKKSNSTGFCKLWRVQELIKRSNSDGRDAYVFFNGSSSKNRSEPSSSAATTAAAARQGKTLTLAKVKKSTKGKSEAMKAHEKYMRSREEDRRKTYLPYRPELMGFFTNIHGGLSRNVHPF